jgi:ribosome biogenesis protein ENP2
LSFALQLKVYDLANLSLKFDRHLDAEVVDFQILTDDYSKAAFLCSDRSISFHARFGSYFKVRTPRQGRDLAYAPFCAELLVVGSAPEVYRVSLEEGRFMQPLPAQSPGINACGGSGSGDEGGQLLVVMVCSQQHPSGCCDQVWQRGAW